MLVFPSVPQECAQEEVWRLSKFQLPCEKNRALVIVDPEFATPVEGPAANILAIGGKSIVVDGMRSPPELRVLEAVSEKVLAIVHADINADVHVAINIP